MGVPAVNGPASTFARPACISRSWNCLGQRAVNQGQHSGTFIVGLFIRPLLRLLWPSRLVEPDEKLKREMAAILGETS